MKKKTFSIIEHKALYCDSIKSPREDESGHVALPIEHYSALEKFYFANASTQEFFLPATISGKKGLRARHHVGLIQFADGTTVEVLPKIAQDRDDFEKSRTILLKMLRTLKNSPFRYLDNAQLKAAHLPLFEIFVSMFLDSLQELIRRGIKSDYVVREENQRFLKGKLKVAEHLRQNHIHKERFYVRFDEFISDRVENRLIKTTLHMLYKRSHLDRNLRRIRESLFIFDEVGISRDHRNDFKRVKLDRQMAHYEQVLKWCRIFLSELSFSPNHGKEIAFALLFDMNKLFEDYVGAWFKKRVADKVALQDSSYSLLYRTDGGGKFRLRPDIVIDDGRIVVDTKWKILSKKIVNDGISQADIYQLFAYGTKYEKCERVILIYPKNGDNLTQQEFFFEDGKGKSNVKKLTIAFFDLELESEDQPKEFMELLVLTN